MNEQKDNFGKDYYNPNCVVSDGAKVKPFNRCNSCKIKVKNCLGMRMNLVTFYVIVVFVVSLKVENIYIVGGLEFVAAILLIYMSKYTNRETDRLVENSRALSDLHERLVKGTKEKESLFSLIGHELRTPLASILGHADQMKVQKIERSDHNIQKIIHEGNHLLKAINNIMEISALDTIIKVDKEDLNIYNFHSFLNENLDSHLAKEKSVDFRVNVATDFPAVISTDKSKIYDIVKKLSSNAIKFTEQGYVHIHLTVIRSSHQLEINVTDTGRGIKEEDLESIFTPFSNLQDVITRDTGGLGIDLYVCKKIIDSLNGTIHIKSQVGVGTVFNVDIPIEIISESIEKPVVDEAQSPLDTGEKSQANILIVEDTEDIQEILEFYIEDELEGENYKIDFALNGKIAVEMAYKNQYDLIFMDLHMPVMGGLEATTMIRKNGHKGPIVAFTADARINISKICEQHGLDDLLQKPLQRDKLARILEIYYPYHSKKIAS